MRVTAAVRGETCQGSDRHSAYCLSAPKTQPEVRSPRPCFTAAREQCPAFPGQPVYAHWGMPDPSRVTGDETAKRHAFEDAVLYLRQRIDFLLLIPFEKLERAAREQRIKAALEEQTADGAPD